jgi:hypothetical protein
VNNLAAPWDVFGDKIRERMSVAGYAAPGSIPEDMTFLEWVQDLADAGLKVDGLPFRLDDRPTLQALYEAIPTTIAEAQRQTIVVMKASQVGATVWEMLADIYMALKFEPLVVGMFLPDQALAGDKSERRFMPVIRSIPDVYRKLTTRITLDNPPQRIGEGNILTRIMGSSAFLFLWTTGRVTTESRPMDLLSLDEVQAMSLEEIDKVYERMSASRVRFRMMLSTANVPDADIDFWFKQGSQQCFHSRCPECGAENDLSAHWPDCCIYNEGQIPSAPMNEWVYVCPDCAGWIEDTQDGRFIAANPGSSVRSWHISQIISPTITPRDMAEAWNRAVTGDQRKTFFNRKLGRPYIDSEQLPVTMAHCLECMRQGIALGLRWDVAGQDTYMGVDQMGGYNAVIIKRRLPDGRQAVVWVEAVFDIDPFRRCAELMDLYGVTLCVVEQLPNVNDARRFANEFRGRVYLAGYSTDPKTDMLVWGDQQTRSDRKTAEADRTRYTVNLQQYKAMQASLFRIKNYHTLFPDSALLEQDVIERGERKRLQIVRDWVFLHFTKTALVVDMDEETRAYKPRVVKIGMDPHFSFANMLCDVAWSRNHGMSSFILPENVPRGGKQEPETPMAQKLAKNMPGIPASVLQMIDDGVREGTCGRCAEFDKTNKQCTLRAIGVTADMVSCVLYDPAPRR